MITDPTRNLSQKITYPWGIRNNTRIPAIRVGTIVIAIKPLGSLDCNPGDRAICYWIRPGQDEYCFSFLFKNGDHNDFYPGWLDEVFEITDEVISSVKDYVYKGSFEFEMQYIRRYFDEAFDKEEVTKYRIVIWDKLDDMHIPRMYRDLHGSVIQEEYKEYLLSRGLPVPDRGNK